MVNIKLNFFLAFKYENVIAKMAIINIAGRSIRLNTPKNGFLSNSHTKNHRPVLHIKFVL